MEEGTQLLGYEYSVSVPPPLLRYFWDDVKFSLHKRLYEKNHEKNRSSASSIDSARNIIGAYDGVAIRTRSDRDYYDNHFCDRHFAILAIVGF